LSSDQPNPYAAPQAEVPPTWAVNAGQNKIEAVIKDANQFWLAIFLCIFCSGLGAIIIAPWYLARLWQWNSLAKAQPLLLDPQVPHGSIQQRFQSARWKLMVGIGFGPLVLMLMLTCLSLLQVVAMVGRAVAPPN
jgi:hypothetical protein